MIYSDQQQNVETKQMTTTPRFTSADLEAFPLDDGKRYEIIDGELYVSKQPHNNHQRVCYRIGMKLTLWCDQAGDGEVLLAQFCLPAPPTKNAIVN